MRWWLAWLILLSAFISSRWLFPAHWRSLTAGQARLASQTIDCLTSPLSPELEMGAENADRLFRSGRVQVLVAAGDGCYKTQAEVMAYSIVRTRKSRVIYSKEAFARATTGIILELSYLQLDERRKGYADRKFKGAATKMNYTLVTFHTTEDLPRPPQFPQQHPGVQSIDLSDAVRLSKQGVLIVGPKLSEFKAAKSVVLPHERQDREFIDPESQDTGTESTLALVPHDQDLVVVSENDRDFTAYNFLTLLQLTKRSGTLYWVSRLPEVMRKKEQVRQNPDFEIPESLGKLVTVNCWQAIAKLNQGVPESQGQKSSHEMLWLGGNSFDWNFYRTAATNAGVSTGFYLPGGGEQLKWCQQHLRSSDVGQDFEDDE